MLLAPPCYGEAFFAEIAGMFSILELQLPLPADGYTLESFRTPTASELHTQVARLGHADGVRGVHPLPNLR